MGWDQYAAWDEMGFYAVCRRDEKTGKAWLKGAKQSNWRQITAIGAKPRGLRLCGIAVKEFQRLEYEETWGLEEEIGLEYLGEGSQSTCETRGVIVP